MPGLTAETSVIASDLELRFGAKVALARSDLAIPSDGITAVIGPNGSGKSTLLGAISGLHPAASGTIRVLGMSPHEARSMVAFVPQSTKVNDTLPVTVREIVAMGRYATLGMLGRFGTGDAHAVAETMTFMDLDDLAANHLSQLSGGQRQRVFVAQGLVQERRLLLLDEPTNALDLVSAQVIRKAMTRERSAGRPVIVTTHDLGEARRADHVVLLAGRVIAAGPPDAVLTSTNLTDAYQFDVGEIEGQLHVDDAAHDPTGARHRHVEPHGHRPPERLQ